MPLSFLKIGRKIGSLFACLLLSTTLLISMPSAVGVAYSQVTTYQPLTTTYTQPTGFGDSTFQSGQSTFNTDQIYNPIIGSSSQSMTQMTSPYAQVPVQQTEATPDYNIKGKLPIYVTGDYVEYRPAVEKVVAKGAAEVKNDKMDLIANNIEADLLRELIFAQGNVVFWQEQNGKLKKITGEFLVYNTKTGDGFMLDAIIFSDPTVTKAKRVELSSTKIVAPLGATYTTCDLDHHHWAMQASEVTIYPNDKMILKKPRYEMFGITWFKLPYATMNLRKAQERKFKMNFGYTKPKGLYQSMNWDYSINEDHNGTINVENQSKRGNFESINHNSRYNFMQKLTGTFNTNYYNDSFRGETNARSSLAGQYQLKTTSNLNYNIDYYSTKSGGVLQNREIDNQFNLSYNEENYDFLARYKKRNDLSGKPPQYISSLDYTPEINVNTRREKILKTPLFLSTRSIIGTREETLSGDLTRRNIFDTQWRMDTERFQLSSQTNMTLDSSYRLRSEKKDERENILDGGVTFVQNMGKKINANLRYNNTRSYGYYPFQSNQITNQNKLYSTLAYNGDSVSEKGTELRSNLLQFYYDYDNHQFQGVSNDLTLTHKIDKFIYHRFYFRASYDYHDTMFSNFFTGSMNLTNLYMKYDYQLNEKINWQTSTIYDRITRKYQTLNSTIQFDAGPFWRVNADVIYDLPTKELRNVNYYLIRDLHCMEATIRANPHQKEYFIEFGIKAFPEDRQRGYYDKTAGKFKRVNPTDRLFY